MEVADNFASCLAFTLLPSNDGQALHVTPGDPGGATAWGVIQTTYDTYREHEGLVKQSVGLMTDAERDAIYREGYWQAGLPAGLDLMVFDFAVTSGFKRSVMRLQASVGVEQDGWFGPETLTALGQWPVPTVVANLAAWQLDYYENLSTFARFGRGWTRRTNDRKAAAMKMVPANA